MNTRMITKTRGVLISQILRKTFVLDYEEAKKSAALTLMSTDIEGISRVLPKVHEAWAGLIELGVGIYLLSTIVKEASILVIIPALGMLQFCAKISLSSPFHHSHCSKSLRPSQSILDGGRALLLAHGMTRLRNGSLKHLKYCRKSKASR